MAAVACVRTELGPFLAVAMLEGKGELERWRVEGFEVCRKARATCLAEGDRSILSSGKGEWRGEKRKEKGGRREESNPNRVRRYPERESSRTARGETLSVVECGDVVDCRMSRPFSHQLGESFSRLPIVGDERCGEASSASLCRGWHVQPITGVLLPRMGPIGLFLARDGPLPNLQPRRCLHEASPALLAHYCLASLFPRLTPQGSLLLVQSSV